MVAILKHLDHKQGESLLVTTAKYDMQRVPQCPQHRRRFGLAGRRPQCVECACRRGECWSRRPRLDALVESAKKNKRDGRSLRPEA